MKKAILIGLLIAAAAMAWGQERIKIEAAHSTIYISGLTSSHNEYFIQVFQDKEVILTLSCFKAETSNPKLIIYVAINYTTQETWAVSVLNESSVIVYKNGIFVFGDSK